MGLKEIYSRLNMTPDNGLCIIEEGEWKNKLPKRLENLIEKKLNPKAFFCFDNKPLILFYDSPQNRQKLFKEIWNFNESPIVIINEPNTIEILNGFSYLKDRATLDKLEDSKNLNNFSYFELVTGKSLEQYRTKLKQNKRVDFHLLENIREARKILIDTDVDPALSNAIIGKCIFVRYLIDRQVRINFEGPQRIWTNNEFCSLFDNKTKLIKFFKYLRKQFNGEAFLLHENNLQNIPKQALSVLKDLLNGTQLSSGQLSLFDIYDFSIIPVEFISNVYEFFIGKENQAEQGAYYTPKFLVDYILSETVEKYFQDNRDRYDCKVLDPACGSGIFLVEILRRIIERYIELNDISIETKKFRTDLKRITEENIFGIDADSKAINVAVFSIYLALLDYQEPKDIEKFKFPKLIQNGNFHTVDFFNKDAEFNSQFSKINFDFIVGNPPWKRGAPTDALFLQYIKDRKQKELNKKVRNHECSISNKEIAQAFLLRTSDFSTEQTKCSLIITSKILYNIKAKKFRSYFLHNYFIDKVFELAAVRKEIFDKSNDKAIAPAAILFFRYSHGKNTESNELKHLSLKPNRLFSLFKIFVLQMMDIKTVVQKRLLEYDWLWKVMVYGSYLDFNLLKRLKGSYKTIGNVINDNRRFLVKQGLKIRDGKIKIDVQNLMGWDFIRTNELNQYFVSPQRGTWTQREVGYIYTDASGDYSKLFSPPVLLVKGGINNKFESVSAISYGACVFKSSLTGINGKNNEIVRLRIINALLNSKLFSYNILHTGSSAGIEREESEDEEKWNTPYIYNPELAKLVKRIEKIIKGIYAENQEQLNLRVSLLDAKKQKLINQLNEVIFRGFDLGEQERALVDYAINITIPLIMKHKGYEQKVFSFVPFKDSLVEGYIKVFLLRFENLFKQKHLKAEILHTANIIGIFFKVVPNNSPRKQLIEWKNEENEALLRKITSLGVEKITEKLFIQKDIRGFERDGFYIIKPNEKKLWHKAIAYLDVNEFMDAILKTGRDAQDA